MANYYNPNGTPPPPGSAQNAYPPPPRPQQYDGQAYSHQGYSSPAPQSSYYQPPLEDQHRYSPRSSGMQVDQYREREYDGRERRRSGPYAASQYRGSEDSYYAPSHHHDDRASSRGSRRERPRSKERGEKHEHHEAEKAVGATLLGGAVAGWAGHELGHKNNLVTVASALAGAYAGHKLESRHEKDKKKKQERRESQSAGYEGDYVEDDRSRSLSGRRSRSRSRRRSASSSDEDSDDSRRRHHHHRH